MSSYGLHKCRNNGCNNLCYGKECMSCFTSDKHSKVTRVRNRRRKRYGENGISYRDINYILTQEIKKV